MELTRELLLSLFDYKDGEIFWKVSGAGRKIGVPAGRHKLNGYGSTTVKSKGYYTHRLIFLYHHGYLPKFLDHIDGDKSNNGINNLREATRQKNGMNRKKQKSHNGKPTTSIYKGVSWHKKAKKWRARIRSKGELKHLGMFTSEIEAAKAYNKAATKYHGKFAYLNIIDASKPL